MYLDPFFLPPRFRWPRFPWGLWDPFWVINHELVEELVRKHQLKAIPAEVLPQEPAPFQVETKAELVLRPRPFPGGMRAAHVHLRNELFLMQEEQWQAFAGGVIRDFQKKLEGAKVVGVEQLLELSNAVDGLTQHS